MWTAEASSARPALQSVLPGKPLGNTCHEPIQIVAMTIELAEINLPLIYLRSGLDDLIAENILKCAETQLFDCCV